MNAKSRELFVYQWFADVNKENFNTIIRIYGVAPSNGSESIQKNVCLKVTNFKPYCFIEIPGNVPANAIYVRLHIKKFVIEYEEVSKSHLYNTYNKYKKDIDGNYTNNNTLFLKAYFENKKNMQDMVYFLQNNDVCINGVLHKLSVHEHNANPVLQLICSRNIDSVGWIDYGSAKRVQEIDEKKETACDEEYTILWQHLKKGKYTHNIQPKTFAFDMEVTSSIPSAFPSNLPKDEIFQISCVIVENNGSKRKILLTLEPKTHKEHLVETLEKESIITYTYPDEISLLESFIKLINDEKPNICTGYNIFGFDIEYLIKRCRC